MIRLKIIREDAREEEYFHTSENVPVNLFSRVDFPTEGNPTSPTLASPLLVTSKPSPAPPPPFDVGVRSSRRSFASLAWHHMVTNNINASTKNATEKG